MRRFLFLLMSLVLLSVYADAQTKQKYGTTASKKAKAAYDRGRAMEQAGSKDKNAVLACYKEALQLDPNYLEALISAAQIYEDMGQPGNQFNCLSKAMGIDSTFHVHSYRHGGVALCYLGRFQEAMVWFDNYMRFAKVKKIKVNADANRDRRLAKAIFNIINHPVAFQVSYPTPQIPNMDFETYWPSLTLDERELVVTSRLPIDTVAYRKDRTMIARINNNETQEDFYVATRKSADDEWGTFLPMSNINTPFNEGAQALSPDGRWMFYTAGGYADSKGSCDLYFSQRTDKGWTKGINIGAPVNTSMWESQPCFSADGKTLFFVRGNPGAQSRKGDIYMAKVKGVRADGVPIFDRPVPMGDSINTEGDESHPFLHADGKTLYFSSTGWDNLGAFRGSKDMFMSRLKDDGTWSRPVNIGYPVNTMDDDEGLVVLADGKTGYFNTTSRDDLGRTKREVKRFVLPEHARAKAVPYVRGVIKNCTNDAVIDAQVQLDKMPEGNTVVISRTLTDGSFVTALPAESDYQLSVTAPGYFFRTFNFTADDIRNANGRPVELSATQVCLSPLIKGQKIALRNIFFDTDKWDIKPESKVELEKLAKVMRENPKIRIEISGHTDSRASVKHNQVLSENRAKSTVDYLVNQLGIARNRFVTVGYGLSQPCATNETEEGRALNRRIEARIVE